MPTITVFTFNGMSCGHCERTVTAGLNALPGITGVSADMQAGRIIIESSQPLDDDQVRAAATSAGFTLGDRL
ncbi:heavy-metal-associated domain-containing protein [Kitasatospora sp. CB01950]|uniref:heavy-metal-associated domain-containing protein n=1 Tax=Kitasatospora sp. CB01950 TaxID=1703930 RepID=UPI00093DE583|nr:heavy-metal-associated domain-containing protein [Kitasatospora sp. CB01950]OKJ03264.1 copper-transporting ATPase [Kitasatospora sp. CB01950]